MVDYVTTAPNLKNPHLNGPPTMADLLFDYYAKAQYAGITPLALEDEVVEDGQVRLAEENERDERVEEER